MIDVRALPPLTPRRVFEEHAGGDAAGQRHQLSSPQGAQHAQAGGAMLPKGAGGRWRRLCRAAPLPEAQAQAAAQLRASPPNKPSALLCFEHDPKHCHRTMLCARRRQGV